MYADVVADVVAELAARVERCRAAGIAEDRLVLDPGFGFAKTGEHNWQLLQHLEALDALGLPVLAGVSRKGFLGTLLAGPDGAPRPAQARDDASLALTTVLAERGTLGRPGASGPPQPRRGGRGRPAREEALRGGDGVGRGNRAADFHRAEANATASGYADRVYWG